MKFNFPKTGKVLWLCVRPEELEPVKVCDSVFASDRFGLEGDHFNGKPADPRMVPLIQSEHIA